MPRFRSWWLLWLLTIAACDTPAGRFAAWLWSPDRVATSGTQELRLEGAPAPITVWFDAHAVPHIEAPDERSLAYAVGYLHARDRRFQLECFKLAAHGRLREMVGAKDQSGVLKNLELYGRLLGFTTVGRTFLAGASAEDRHQLDAYAAGVNDSTAREPRCLEFRLLDYQPAPWTPEDTAAIIAMISFGLCKNWSLEVARLELIVHQLRTGGSIERALRLWPARRVLPPHLIDSTRTADPFAAIPVLAPELADHLDAWVREAGSVPLERLSRTAGVDRGVLDAHHKEGGRSNNWAISGQRAGTGRAGLASDPHMVHAMPPLGYLLHVHVAATPAGPVEAIGGGFPGLPNVVFGTNGRVAWGITANWADVSDVYVERLAPADANSYCVESGVQRFRVREEVFKIRRADGGFDTERKTVRETRHGVVLNDFIDHIPQAFPILALRWSPGTRAIAAYRGLYAAKNVQEAQRALQQFDAMVGHWVLADDQGNVGYAATMPLPRRTRHLGTLPVPGWTGTYEWDGTVGAAELPAIVNPTSGIVATANNQVVHPDATGYPINFEGDVNHRYVRILEVLGARQGSVVATNAALQQDGIDMGHRQVLTVTGAALEALRRDPDPLVAAAASAYLDWDGDARPDAVGATVYQSLCAGLVQHLLADEVGSSTLHFVLTYFNVEPFVYGLLTDAANPAWDDRLTPEVETTATVVPQVFRTTVAALRQRYGADVRQWTWSRAAPFVLEHAFGQARLLAPIVNRGPLPTRGTGNTVFKHQFMRDQLVHFPVKYGPVLRLNVDLADLTKSRMSIPGGQSGRPGSPHYADLLALYLEGEGVSMQLGFAGIEQRCVGKLVLRPVR